MDTARASTIAPIVVTSTIPLRFIVPTFTLSRYRFAVYCVPRDSVVCTWVTDTNREPRGSHRAATATVVTNMLEKYVRADAVPGMLSPVW